MRRIIDIRTGRRDRICRRALVLALVVLAAARGSRAAGHSTGPQEVALVRIAEGFDNLVGIAHAGDPRLFLLEKDLGILVGDADGIHAVPFLDLGDRLGTGAYGEGGLLGVAFHPQFAANGYLFVYYVDTAGATVVARYERSLGSPDLADPDSGVILLRVGQPLGSHYGGQLLFGFDGYLYVILGDGGPSGDPACRSQRLDRMHGKLLRIDVDQNLDVPPYYGIPADNPFVGPDDPPDEVWAIGFRNPWRFTVDRLLGDLYVADVGDDTREEVNVIAPGSGGGANYGWKVMEGTTCFAPDPSAVGCPETTPSCFSPLLTPPAFEYPHTDGNCSITGGYVYRGANLPELFGWYLYGDWCSGNLWAASEDQGGWTSLRLRPRLPGLVAFGEDAAGEIFLSNGSALFLLAPTALFADDFESGDTSAWTNTIP